MSKTGVIVAGIDGSNASLCAARWAALDAARRRTTLRLVHAVVASPSDNYPEPLLTRPRVTEQQRANAEELLQRTAAQLTVDHPGLHIEHAQLDGPPVKVLVDQSLTSIATVVGSHGSGRLSDAFFGSVTARLAAHGHGSIVIARPENTTNATGGPGAVVVAVDGSPQARAAVCFAYEEAALRDTTLVAMYSWNDKPLTHALGSYPLAINTSGIDEREHQPLEAELAGWEQKYPQVPVRMRVLRGRPTPNLLRYASTTGDHPAQLLVMGSRGRGGFTGLLLGSTSQAVIAHAECSVAVLHTAQAPR